MADGFKRIDFRLYGSLCSDRSSNGMQADAKVWTAFYCSGKTYWVSMAAVSIRVSGKYSIIEARLRTMYEDKTLICKECGNEFVFTAGEQEFYASKGLSLIHI